MTALAEQQVQKLKLPMQQSLERGVADAALALRGEQLWVRERGAEALRQELHSMCAEHRKAVREDLAAQRAELLPLLGSSRGMGVSDTADKIEETLESGRKDQASMRRLAEQHAQQAAAHSELVKVVLSERDARAKNLREAAETCVVEAHRNFSAEVSGLEARVSRLEDGHQTQAAALRRQAQALEAERKASSMEGADLRSQLRALQDDLGKPASVALCGDEGAGAPASGTLASISADVTKRLEFGLSRLEDIVGSSIRQLSQELRIECEERSGNVAELRSHFAAFSDGLTDRLARLERQFDEHDAKLGAPRLCDPAVLQAPSVFSAPPAPVPPKELSRAVARSSSEPSIRAGCCESDCPPDATGCAAEEDSSAPPRAATRGRRSLSGGPVRRGASMPAFPSHEVQMRRVELVRRVMSMGKTPDESDRSCEASGQVPTTRPASATPTAPTTAVVPPGMEGLTLQQRRVAMIKQVMASP